MLLALLGALLLDEASEEARLGTLRELRNRTGTSGLVTRRRRDGVLDALLSLEGQYGLPVMAQTAYVLLIEVPPFETPSFYRDVLGYQRHTELQDLAGQTDFREWPALAQRLFGGVNDP